VATSVDHSVIPIGQLGVEMGPGNRDSLTVLSCTGDQAFFQDTGGTNALLIKSGNHFTTEFDTGFSSII
jgi:hypothetical protein